MHAFDRDHEAILGVLASRGIASSQALQAATGKSQPSVSRLLADLQGQVLTLGKARATRYALPQSIRGLPAQQPLLWTTASGSIQNLGTLSFLSGGLVHVESEFVRIAAASTLPWFLAPLRAQGFLGRLHARRLGSLGGDPEQWGLDSVLYSALHLHDTAGAITLGDSLQHPPLTPLPAGADTLPPALDVLAGNVAEHLPAGSSAAGAQPKFVAALEGGQHVMVKFTPPRGTPFGERWHDLLHAEWLANQVLQDHGVAVASTRIVESGARTYLVSDRFDRVGPNGRLHVVAIWDAHKAFVPGSFSHWAASAAALARQGRLDPLDAERAAALRAFGQLIGNTDMHGGNLALMVTLDNLARGRFSLAPVYDMLPMRWRPQESVGWSDYAAFEPDRAALSGPAAGPALDFWQRLEAHAPVDRQLRQVAGEMARRLAT